VVPWFAKPATKYFLVVDIKSITISKKRSCSKQSGVEFRSKVPEFELWKEDKMGKNFTVALVDYFVHPSLRVDSDTFLRGRILIGSMLAFAVAGISAFILVLLTHFPLQSIIYGGAICLPTSGCFIGLLILLRRKGSYEICTAVSVLLLMTIVIAGISVSGGPAVSPVIQLMAIPPLTAYFFGGLRWGSYTVAISLVSLLILVILHMYGFGFLQTVEPAEKMLALNFIVGFVNLSVISVMAFIYEFTAASLRRERDLEHEKYIRLAKTDPLTGLANRRNFDAMLLERMEIYGTENPPRRFALGYLDLDGFKPINDQYGHGVGDEVLRVVSDRLRAALRGSDFVGRHGGDEFMLMLDMVGDQSSLEAMAQRLLNSIANPISTTAGIVKVSGSLGFAMYPLDSAEIEELKKSADTAMYEAKREHDTWRFFKRPPK
jgi:diguanylate cyclase (GGDEF)-like protein